MTNEEKFKEVFGLKPYTGSCPFDYPNACKNCKHNGNNRHCDEIFWGSKYEEPSTREGALLDER